MKAKVLFVCMGNICRSPTAHGVMQHKLNERNLNHLIELDSAGTHAYHVGLPMDQDNLELINYNAPQDYTADIRLFLDFANTAGVCQEALVPDPYYGGDAGFEHVFNLVDLGCDALIKHILDA